MLGVDLRKKIVMMHCYIVLYDLCKPDRNYNRLYLQLRSYERWGRLTESAWAIVTKKAFDSIRDELRACIDDNDRLIVIRSGQQAAWTNVMASNEWLKDNLIL